MFIDIHGLREMNMAESEPQNHKNKSGLFDGNKILATQKKVKRISFLLVRTAHANPESTGLIDPHPEFSPFGRVGWGAS